MKFIERRFRLFEKKYPDYFDFVVFSLATEKQNFSRQKLSKWFYKLVDKDDYEKRDSVKLLRNLEKETNALRSVKKRMTTSKLPRFRARVNRG